MRTQYESRANYTLPHTVVKVWPKRKKGLGDIRFNINSHEYIIWLVDTTLRCAVRRSRAHCLRPSGGELGTGLPYPDSPIRRLSAVFGCDRSSDDFTYWSDSRKRRTFQNGTVVQLVPANTIAWTGNGNADGHACVDAGNDPWAKGPAFGYSSRTLPHAV